MGLKMLASLLCWYLSTAYSGFVYELITEAGQPMPFYARYAENSESKCYFLQSMHMKSTGVDQVGTSQSAAFVIPLTIEKIAGGRVS